MEDRPGYLIYIPNDSEVDDLDHHIRQILGYSLEE
jgi:hypothetical protein